MKKVVLFIVCLAIFSCETTVDDPGFKAQNGSGMEIKDGIAVFNDMEAFLTTAEKVGELNSKEYGEWSEENKFYSRYTEYQEEIGKKTISENSLRPDGSLIKNEKGGYYQLNSVNSNYARITNKDGLVIIGGSTYQFTYSEIKKIDGVSQSSISSLLKSKTKADYERSGIIASEVQVVGATERNAKTSDESVVVERKTQQGPDISGDAFWDWYLDATLEIRGYSLPGCAICPPPAPGGYFARYTAVVELFYYSDGLFVKDKEIPSRFELAWSFVRERPPLAPNTGETITGSYMESGVSTVLRTISDGGKILSYDIDAKALDNRFSEALKTSGTRIVRQ